MRHFGWPPSLHLMSYGNTVVNPSLLESQVLFEWPLKAVDADKLLQTTCVYGRYVYQMLRTVAYLIWALYERVYSKAGMSNCQPVVTYLNHTIT